MTYVSVIDSHESTKAIKMNIVLIVFLCDSLEDAFEVMDRCSRIRHYDGATLHTSTPSAYIDGLMENEQIGELHVKVFDKNDKTDINIFKNQGEQEDETQ